MNTNAIENINDILPEKQENIRDDQGRFIPGVSGNPNGRPKGKVLTELVRDKMEEKDAEGVFVKDKVVNAVVSMALEGNIKALELVWNYLDGKPTQTIELGDGDKLDAMRNDLNNLIKHAKNGTLKIKNGRKKNMPVSTKPVSN